MPWKGVPNGMLLFHAKGEAVPPSDGDSDALNNTDAAETRRKRVLPMVVFL